ncbi:ABC transporter permease [Spiroplasma endosymbiont of Othius punctulatus]|uniref:ABC transporter permease n=1 Tax=Spiroplasma endosymbiont of Othius punctulatus TaxID=3066289 RepID=UPI0030CE494F
MKSFRLLFKNGFKQLFQFKFSLLAVLILSMVGSLVISTSVTTVKKLNNEFETVVNSQEKFSNVYENESLVGQNSDFSFLPILDFVSKENSTSAFINFDGEVQSNFNLDLVSEDTFIGQYFTSDEFKSVFPFLLTIYSVDRITKTYLMTPHTKVLPYLNGTITNKYYNSWYKGYYDFWLGILTDKIKSHFDSYKGSDIENSTWYTLATDLFFREFVNGFEKKHSQFDETLIGEFTKENSGWYNDFSNKTWSQNLKDNSNNEYFEMYKYTHFTLSTLISQIMYMADDVLEVFRSNASNYSGWGGYYDRSKYAPFYIYKYIFGTKSYEEMFVEEFSKLNEDTSNIWLTINIENSEETIQKSPYEWSEFETINDKLILSEGEIKNFKEDSGSIKTLNYAPPIKQEDFVKDFFTETLVGNKGFKGQLNPVITINKNSENKEEYKPTVIAKNDFKSLQGISDGVYFNWVQNKDVKQSDLLSAFYQADNHGDLASGMYGIDFESLYKSVEMLGLTDVEYQPVNWELEPYTTIYDNPLNYYYKFHLNLAADMVDMNLTIRDELVYSDVLAGKKYRLITMESLKNTNFELLSGTAPNKRGEVAVSVQYAKYNKVEVGDLIKIGNAYMGVVGIAVDAYSFYPTVDPMMPVPKPKTSGIMYMQDETLNEIFKGDTSQMDMSSYKQSVYMYAKDNKQKNDFLYNANLSNSNYYQNHLNHTDPDGKDQIVPMKMKTFDESVESLNWTIYGMFIKIFTTSITSVLLLIVAAIFILLYLVIRKSIELNIEKIAILISIGYKPIEIAVSYLWYGIVISVIAVPLGWIIGTFLQIPIQRLLQDFFTIDSSQILFSWEAALISFAVIGLLVGVVLTMLISWIKMSKPYIELINENNIPSKNVVFTFIKTKIIKNTGFKRRLIFDVASSSSRNLILMSVLILVSSFMVSNLIFIPSVALTTKSKYLENVKYKNEFKLNDPITNDPQSSKNINFWEGVDANIDSMTDINYEIGKTKDTRIINRPNGYNSISANSSLLPQLLYSPGEQGIRSSYDDIVNDPSEMVSVVYGAITYNFHAPNGKSLSIGMFDQLITENMNENNGLSMKAKSKDADRIIRTIAGALPSILKMVKFPNMDFEDGVDWKEALLRSFTTKAPSYIKEYIGVKERQSAINFGFNTVNVVPGKDTLGTSLTVNSDSGNLDVVGVNNNQTAFEIPNKAYDKLYGKDKDVNDIYKYFNGEINDINEKNKYYDKNTNTLNIPIVVNQNQKIVNGLNVGDVINGVNSNSKKYVLNAGNAKDFVIPNAAWKYDDTDFYQSDYFKTNFGKDDTKILNPKTYTKDAVGHVYKNPFTIDPNKTSYKNQYSHVIDGKKDDYYETLDAREPQTRKPVTLNDGAYMYGDFAYDYDENGNTKINASYLRPYYNYRNFKLFIPTTLIGDTAQVNKFVTNNGAFGSSNEMKKSNWIDENGNAKTIKSRSVPKDTINAYEKSNEELEINDNTEWVMVKPFDTDVFTTYRGNEQYMDTFSSAYSMNYWLKEMMQRSDGELNGLTVKSTPNNELIKPNVNFKVVDILDTYSGVGIITNSDLLNLLISVENNKQTIFDHSRLDKNNWAKKDEGLDLYNKRKFETLNTNNWEYDAYIKGSQNDVYDSLVNTYSNTVFSNVKEPLQITTGVSMQTKDGSSTFAMHEDFNTLSIAIENALLLDEQNEVIDQIFKLTMFIAIIFITIILIIVIIVIFISSDIYLSRLRMFIVSLKAFGYRKREIQILLFSISFILVLLSTTVGFLISWGLVSAIIGTIISFGMAVPFVVSPLVPLIAFGLLIPLWIIGSVIISNKILLLKPVDGFKQS